MTSMDNIPTTSNSNLTSPIIVFGTTGQVGKALLSQLKDMAVTYPRKIADFSQPQQIKTLLESLSFRPRAIINAAAYTAVDLAESEEELAHRINAESPAVIASFCAENNIPFIHYSTDYVFDGNGTSPRPEENPTEPLNAYGRTKLAGEKLIAAAGGRYIILRTSWVYDETGRNFLNTMLRLGNERESLRVVNDQTGAPTYAPHLAETTLAVLYKAEQCDSFPSGIYHACGEGETTWHGFAEMIFSLAREQGIPLQIKTVEGIPSELYPTPATRPLNSRLDCHKLIETFGVSLPEWKESLAYAIQQKLHWEKVA